MIELKTTILEDSYTDYIREHYDYNPQRSASVRIPSFRIPEGDWNIISIIGSSGSGKSTILKHLGGGQEPIFDNRPIVSNLNLPPKEASELLCAMGLASVPSWCRPLEKLSNGEQYRAKLAKQIATAEGIILIDEFTSVVDRNAAIAMSNALQKYVRRKNLKVILASCHYDILPYLSPDYIFDLNKGGVLERGDCLRRPSIPLRLYRVESDTWRIFARHHYMTSHHNDSAACYLLQWDNKPIAFCSVLTLFGRGIIDSYRVHRLVVLPDFQGLGIARTFLDTLGALYSPKKLFIKSVNPAIGFALSNDPNWKPTAHNLKYRAEVELHDWLKTKSHQARASFCYQYCGPSIPDSDNITLPIDKIRSNRFLEGQLSLF